MKDRASALFDYVIQTKLHKFSQIGFCTENYMQTNNQWFQASLLSAKRKGNYITNHVIAICWKCYKSIPRGWKAFQRTPRTTFTSHFVTIPLKFHGGHKLTLIIHEYKYSSWNISRKPCCQIKPIKVLKCFMLTGNGSPLGL